MLMQISRLHTSAFRKHQATPGVRAPGQAFPTMPCWGSDQLAYADPGSAADQKQASDTHSRVWQSPLRGTVGRPYQCHRVCSLKALGPIRPYLCFSYSSSFKLGPLVAQPGILNTAAERTEPLRDSCPDSSQKWQFTMRKEILRKADKLTYENTEMRVRGHHISETDKQPVSQDRVIIGFERMTLH